MKMKRVHLIALIICLSNSFAFSQKAKVQTAFNYYKEPYQQFDKAKEAIDEAILNESSNSLAKTWYYRGLIYQALSGSEKYGNLCDKCLKVAFESFAKAIQLDPKNEWAEEIKLVRIPYITNAIFQEGVKAFKEQKFNDALISFETINTLNPGDTSVILNSAYSAERSGQSEKAKRYYNDLIEMKYNDDKIYLSLANVYKKGGDTTSALTTIRNGRKSMPDNMNLMLAEINILLSSGKNAEATQALDEAIRKDPNNQNLYLALGSTYDNLANPKDAAGKDSPKPKEFENYSGKAEESYLKGLAINPDNYELNYNLGVLYFNQAAELNNQANGIKDNVLYEKAKAKADAKFKLSEPYLEKALDKNPKGTEEDLMLYDGTLNSLKQLYVRTNEMEKYNKIKELTRTK